MPQKTAFTQTMAACSTDETATDLARAGWGLVSTTFDDVTFAATGHGGPKTSFAVRVRTPADALELAPHATADDARAAFAGRLATIDMDDATRAAVLDQLMRLREQVTASGALACGVLNAPYDDAWAMWTYAVQVLPRPDTGALDPAGIVSRLLAQQLPPESTLIEECEAAGRRAVGVRAYVPLPAGPDAVAPFTDLTLTTGLAAILVFPPDPACVVVVAATTLDPRHLDEITALVSLIARSIELEPTSPSA